MPGRHMGVKHMTQQFAARRLRVAPGDVYLAGESHSRCSGMWKHRNHYDLLEVARSSTSAEVKRAYRIQMLAWHPDKFGAREKPVAEERSKAIRAAYATLSDEKLRAEYERLMPPLDGAEPFDDPLMGVGHLWKRMAAWMKDEDVATSFLRRVAWRTGDLLERGRPISDKLRPFSLEAWAAAAAAGYDPLDNE